MGENMIYIIVGNSGSGKSTLAYDLQKSGFNRIITYTTRPMRMGEINGKDYVFISKSEFLKKYDNNEFIGPTKYAGNFYGTLKSDLIEAEKNSTPAVIIVDINGIEKIKEQFPKSVCIYLYASDEVLEKRMKKRNDEKALIEKRLDEVYDYSKICDYSIDAKKGEEEVLKEVLEIIKKKN